MSMRPPAPSTTSANANSTNSTSSSASTRYHQSLLNPLPPAPFSLNRSTPATATNRTPVITRSVRPSGERGGGGGGSGLGGARQHTFTKPFPVPSYLKWSAFHQRFRTTVEEGGAGLLGEIEMGVGGSASDVLGVGSGGAQARDGKAEGESIWLPTCWDEDDKCSLIELSTDGLGVNFAGSAKYGDRDAAAVRTNRPVPPQCGIYYYEITITDKGLSGYIGLGFSHRDVKLTRLPGWEDNSYGYHGDDGRAFCCLGTGESFGPTFTTGDVVGCGVDYSGSVAPLTEKEVKNGGRAAGAGTEGGKVFFTKNGDLLGYAFSNVHGKLYPSVGLRTPGEMVRANFGAEPFKFDIEGLARERARALSAQITSTPLPPSTLLPSPSPPIPSLLPPSTSSTFQQERTHETLQSLIASYLLHHGYGKTAEAFSRQVTAERKERVKGLFGPEPTSSGPLEEEAPSSDLASSATSNGALRAQLRSLYLSSSISEVRRLLQERWPAVLAQEDDRGGVEFRLGVREFVEGLRGAGRSSSKGKGRASEEIAMDVEGGETYSTPPDSPSSSLDEVLALGRALHDRYSAHPSPFVQEQLRLAFSLLAYEGEEGAPLEVRRLVSQKAREAEADELNGLILVSQSLPPTPHLETLYRHTAAVFQLLGETELAERGGGAMMVDAREVLS